LIAVLGNMTSRFQDRYHNSRCNIPPHPDGSPNPTDLGGVMLALWLFTTITPNQNDETALSSSLGAHHPNDIMHVMEDVIGYQAQSLQINPLRTKTPTEQYAVISHGAAYSCNHPHQPLPIPRTTAGPTLWLLLLRAHLARQDLCCQKDESRCQAPPYFMVFSR
jgi:hypothetical protein